MPHVSKIPLTYKAEKQLIETLNIVLTKISKSDDMQMFLLSLLTPTERIMLAKRLAIIVLIKEGLSESQIASSLHVTRITVSRMQLFLEARGQGYEIALKKLDEEKMLKEFKKLLLSLTKYSIRAAGGYVKPGILD